MKKILIILIWFLYALFCASLLKMFFADINYKNSQVLIAEGYSEYAMYYSEKAISQNANEPNYYRGRAKVNLVKILYTEDPTAISQIKDKVLADLTKAYLLNENNLVTIRNTFPLYYFLAVKDMDLTTFDNNIDSEYFEISKNFFEFNKKRFWNDAGVIASVAKYERKLGLENEYEESVRRIKELRPDLLEWYESFR